MQKLFDVFARAGCELYLVGGSIRDKIRGVESDDWDFATNALPEHTIRILEGAGLKAIPIGIEFGTIQTESRGQKVEITTFRSEESYTKGSRKPTVKWGKTIEEDLIRRDFTFNAIAMRSDGELIDPFNGERDLKDGVINTPQDAQVIFRDDPLRMLRAARFEARELGEVTGHVFCAMRDCADEVLTLSGERIFEEMTKLLMSDKPSKGLKLLKETGILKLLYLDDTDSTSDSCPFIPEVRWAAMLESYDRWYDAREKLTMSNEFFDNVSQLLLEQHVLMMPPHNLRRLMARMGDKIYNLLALHESKLRDRINKLRGKVHTKLPTGTGDIVMAELGLKPGPRLGYVLKKLTSMLIDGEITIDSDFAEIVRLKFN